VGTGFATVIQTIVSLHAYRFLSREAPHFAHTAYLWSVFGAQYQELNVIKWLGFCNKGSAFAADLENII
jgi:hypothetical protein